MTGLAARVVWSAVAAAMWSSAAIADTEPEGESLAGQLLVAKPDMGDPRFEQTVIYICQHSPRGALGLVINRPVARMPAELLLEGFGLDGRSGEPAETDVTIHYGGPVEPGRGFVLHTTDHMSEGSEVVAGDIAFTTDPEMFRDIAAGAGPRRSLVALGYAGWSAGQLEGELDRDVWVVVPADENLIFDPDPTDKWDRAMGRDGVEI